MNKLATIASFSVLLLALIPFKAEAKARKPTQVQITCSAKGKVRARINGQLNVWTDPYCVELNQRYVLNASCHKTGKCEATQVRYLPETANRSLGEFGNPAFQYCTILSGEPQITEFLVDGQWKPLETCRFKDKSFISLDFWLTNFIKFGAQ